MKLYSNKKALYISIALILLLAVFLLWWRFSAKKNMHADITSSNGSHYALDLPTGFEPADFVDYDSMKYQPSLEYENKARDLHVMVIDESKAKIISFGLDYDLDTYMKIASRQLDSAGLYVNKPMNVNNFKALQTEIKGKVKGKINVYRLTCLETPKFFYQLLLWTSDEKYESNKNDMEKIVGSFKEVDK